MDLFNQGSSGADGGTSTASDAGVAEGGILGAQCATDPKSGAQLCAATSMCPSVVVDTQAMPSCGFRVRGAVVDLVCACGTALCPFGTVTTCAEATKFLTDQTEQGVCTQLVEGRCTELTQTPSSSTSGGNPACDRTCVRECGGGAACASVCNCD
jgi:hypothetical protein